MLKANVYHVYASGYVMQVDGALVPNAKIITNQQWKPANENDEETPPPEGASAAEEPQQEEEEEDDNVTARYGNTHISHNQPRILIYKWT